jgi:hypothetical protein
MRGFNSLSAVLERGKQGIAQCIVVLYGIHESTISLRFLGNFIYNYCFYSKKMYLYLIKSLVSSVKERTMLLSKVGGDSISVDM